MAFRLFDIDKNGLIDKNEFETIIKIIYDLTGENQEQNSLNKAINKTENIIKKFGKEGILKDTILTILCS